MSAPPGGSSVLTFQDARRVAEEQAALVLAGKVLAGKAQADATESEDLLAAHGRVLAEPVHADRDLPPFARSTRLADLTEGQKPWKLRLTSGSDGRSDSSGRWTR